MSILRTPHLTKYASLALVILILLVASWARFYQLDAQSFWNDEGLSYINSIRTLPEITQIVTFHDVHPPGYYYLLAGWRVLAGISEFALRSFSVLVSVMGVAFTYALGKRLYHPIAGITAAAFVTLNTFSIFYAQEARMYALLATVSAASMWVFVGLVEQLHQNRWNRQVLRHGLVWIFLNTLGLYTHYTYPLILIVQAVMFLAWILMRWWDDGFQTIGRSLLLAFVAGLLTILPFLPWIAPGLSQLTAQPNISEPATLDVMLRSVQGRFAFGITFEQTMGNMGIAVYLLLIFGLMSLPTTKQPLWGWKLLLPIVWVLLVTGVFMMVGLYLRYLRFLIPVQIAFALWMGRGVWVLWSMQTRNQMSAARYLPRFAAVAVSVLLLLRMLDGLDVLYNAPQFQRDDYKGLIQDIAPLSDSDDAIILNAPGQQVTFNYYYEGDTLIFPLPQSPETLQDDIDKIIDEHDRIFGVFWGADEQDPGRVVENTLSNRTFQISDEWYGKVRFVQYVTPATFLDLREIDISFGESITLDTYAISDENLGMGDILQVQLNWVTDRLVEKHYKVFLQLLDDRGVLVAQRDSEPGAGIKPTTTWQPDETIQDNHALPIPIDLEEGTYQLIVGLYDIDNPSQRLPVRDGDYLNLSMIRITNEEATE